MSFWNPKPTPAQKSAVMRGVNRAKQYTPGAGATVARKTVSAGARRLMNAELQRSATSMAKRWDSAGPAARKYLSKGLTEIRKKIK